MRTKEEIVSEITRLRKENEKLQKDIRLLELQKAFLENHIELLTISSNLNFAREVRQKNLPIQFRPHWETLLSARETKAWVCKMDLSDRIQEMTQDRAAGH